MMSKEIDALMELFGHFHDAELACERSSARQYTSIDSSLDRRFEIIPAVERCACRRPCSLIPRRCQSITGHIQQIQQPIQSLCELHHVEGPIVFRYGIWMCIPGESNRSGNGIKGFDFVHERA